MEKILSAERKEKILKEAKERLIVAMDFDRENRRKALEDLTFVADEQSQWPENIRAERLSANQPCLVINKMPAFIDQVVGDQRQNRPSIKVVPVDSKDDVKTAQLLGGWIRHVQSISKSDVAIDHAFEHAVTCGYGALRVTTNYISDDSFDQEAFIEKIDNALAVYWGPCSQYDCSDAQYCFLVSNDMSKEEFESKYGDNPVNFSDDSMFSSTSKDTVRLAEYFVKEPVKKTIYLLASGEVVDKLEEGQVSVKKREVNGIKIMWYLLSGNEVLDCKEWPGKKYIPIVPVWGKEFNVGGKRYVRGLIRNAKDVQRMYNYWSSIDTELVALQPRNPYLVTPEMIQNHQTMWDEAGKKSRYYVLYDPDRNAPDGPRRESPPIMSSAVTQRVAVTDQEMRDTIGLQKASLGMQGNERSGSAIRERKIEGDTGTFAFIDNLSRSIEHLGRILVDVAPTILDTERVVRLGMEDGSFSFDAVNVQTIEGVLNDLTVGIYDVVVTTGPNYSTQRSEVRQSMQEFIQYYPNAAPLIGDLYAKAMDWKGSDEFAERLAELLPPDIKIKAQLKEAKSNGASDEELAQMQVAMTQPPPNPVAETQLALAQIEVKVAELKVLQEQEKLKNLQLKNQFEFNKGKQEVGKAVNEILEEKLREGAGHGREEREEIKEKETF